MVGTDKMLTIKETLEISGVSRYTAYRDIKSGKLPATYFGKNVRIRESDALKYAEVKGQSKNVAYYKKQKEGTE